MLCTDVCRTPYMKSGQMVGGTNDLVDLGEDGRNLEVNKYSEFREMTVLCGQSSVF